MKQERIEELSQHNEKVFKQEIYEILNKEVTVDIINIFFDCVLIRLSHDIRNNND